jgi:hypothetical protein
MTFFNLRRSLLTAVSAGVLLSTAAMAAADKNKSKSVPFKAAITVSELLGAPTQECYLSAARNGGSAAMATISGVGLASPIGAFTLTSQDCITTTNPTFVPPFTFINSQPVVLRTSNGDIYATYSGDAVGQPATPFVLDLSGTFTFTGGTGRFVGVTGSGKVDGVEDVSTNPAKGLLVLSGDISY